MNNLLSDALRQPQPMQGGQSPVMGGIPIEQQMSQPPQPPFNPFNKGITAAMQSARDSIGSTQDQSHRSIRGGLLGFAKANMQQPKQRGFWNNFASIAPGLVEGLGAYDQGQQVAEAENLALAKEMADRQAMEQARLARAEHEAWNRDFHERQLGAVQRAHNLAHSAKTQGIGLGVDSKFSPITSKPEMARYSKKKSELGAVKKELEELTNEYGKFREKHQEDIIDPMGGYGPLKNTATDLLSKFNISKDAREESAQRKILKSRQNKFVAASEKALKGGVLGPRTIELFAKQGIYPDIDKDTPEEYMGKLKTIIDEIETNHKAADYSLKYGVNIDPSDLMEFESYINPSMPQSMPSPPSISDKRYFLLPTGQKIGIPVTNQAKIQRALEQQLQEVE